MSTDIQLLDVVALTVDLPKRGLRRGQVGTVVEVLDTGVLNSVTLTDAHTRHLLCAPFN